jgi:outer membrane protein assembly factor BamE
MVRYFIIFTFAALFALGGCSSMPGLIPKFVDEYRIDVQQGNVLTQDMVSQLRPGLTRDQVRFILGTPLLVDAFRTDRWDYLFRLKEGKTGEVTERRFTVFFDAEGRLERVTGDVEAREEAAPELPKARAQIVDLGSITPDTPLPEDEGPGFWSRLMDTLGF